MYNPSKNHTACKTYNIIYSRYCLAPTYYSNNSYGNQPTDNCEYMSNGVPITTTFVTKFSTLYLYENIMVNILIGSVHSSCEDRKVFETQINN